MLMDCFGRRRPNIQATCLEVQLQLNYVNYRSEITEIGDTAPRRVVKEKRGVLQLLGASYRDTSTSTISHCLIE